MNIIVDGSNLILMYSEKSAPTPADGCRSIELTAEQRAAFLALPTDRAGVKYDGVTFTALPPVVTALSKRLIDGDLAKLLVAKGLITQADLDAVLKI